MSAQVQPFAYVVLRVIPRIDRGESINAGVVLFCRTLRFLQARTDLSPERLAALAPAADPAPIARHLRTIEQVVSGNPGAGPIAHLEASERFGWIAAPASTVIQPSAVHTGITDAPAVELDRLFAALVA